MRPDISDIASAFSDNVRCLIEEPLMIRTKDGPRQIDPVLYLGEWALHPGADDKGEGWTVTHAPSGLRMGIMGTPIEALIGLGVLLGSGFGEYVDKLGPDYDPAAPPPIHDAAAIQRYQSALLTLAGWDLDLDYNEPEIG
jgi:hypothetical protein